MPGAPGGQLQGQDERRDSPAATPSPTPQVLAATAAVVGQAQRFAKDIAEGVKRSTDVMEQAALEGMKKELETMVPRVKQVMQQTRATEIIRRG